MSDRAFRLFIITLTLAFVGFLAWCVRDVAVRTADPNPKCQPCRCRPYYDADRDPFRFPPPRSPGVIRPGTGSTGDVPPPGVN